MDRVTLGLSLRGDRAYPTAAWLASVREAAQRLGLEIVALAQVERDSLYAQRLASDLGGRAVVFDGRSHREQELVVRTEYGRMRVLLSDRLHSLLIAATEGAVPLGWCEAATTKIARHFEPLGMPWVAVTPGHEADALAQLDQQTLDTLEEQGRKRTAAARTLVEEVAAHVASGRWAKDVTARD